MSHCRKFGTDHHAGKLSDEDVIWMRMIWRDAWNLYEDHPSKKKVVRASASTLGRAFGILPTYASHIIKYRERHFV